MSLLAKLFGVPLSSTTISTASTTGVARVLGIVSCDRPLFAPYTGRPCVYWRLEIRQQKFKDSFLFHRAVACDFALLDKTGRAMVSGGACTYDVVANFVEMERASSLSVKAREVARAHGVRLGEIAQVEVCEAVVVVGDQIEVEGRAMREGTNLTFAGGRVIGLARDAVMLRRGHDY
ncbi:MAG TPA: hypothetical protein VGM39_18470 [Kofleriaceae bacterium]